MQLSRKGPTTGVPLWLLAVLLISLMAKVALQQASSTDAGMQLISWHYVSDLGTQAKHQSKPVLLFFPGVGSAKSATMERTVLTNAIVAKLVVDAYYPVRVEERTAKDFELIKQLHLKYVIAQVPALLIASPGGSKLGIQVGAKSAAETYEFLRTAPTKPADDERRKTSEKVEDSEPKDAEQDTAQK